MNKQRGFTLVELLVVVLIIGILSAIALPQYQKAVVKTRAMQGMTLLRAIKDAAEIYYLTNGQWPAGFDGLDIALPADFTGTDGVYQHRKSNEKWSVGWEDNYGFHSIYVIMISGDYKGAGFSYYHKSGNANIKTGQIYCAETASGGGFGEYTYKKPAGSFCKQLFGGVIKYNYGIYLYEM